MMLATNIGCQSNRTTEEDLATAEQLAKPSAVQYKWHEQERIMFIHFIPATWRPVNEERSFKVPPDRMNPTKLSTDQWCEVALSWGAKEVLFVAKHGEGFCWWQTDADYSIKKHPL